MESHYWNCEPVHYGIIVAAGQKSEKMFNMDEKLS